MVDVTRGPRAAARLRDLVAVRSGPVRSGPGLSIATGSTRGARSSETGSRSRRWTRSRDTRTRSMSSSSTPPACWTRSISSSSVRLPSMISAGGSSKRRSVTADARASRSTKSGTSSVPAESISPRVSRLDWPPRSPTTPFISPSRSPIAAPGTFETCSTRPRRPRVAGWPSD